MGMGDGRGWAETMSNLSQSSSYIMITLGGISGFTN